MYSSYDTFSQCIVLTNVTELPTVTQGLIVIRNKQNYKISRDYFLMNEILLMLMLVLILVLTLKLNLINDYDNKE